MSIEHLNLDTDVEALLTEAGLPVSDLPSATCLNLRGVRKAGKLVGIVGIEAYGSVGLLRSLVVAPDHRNAGVGINLVSQAEAWAASNRINTLYLLTTTAERFFARQGYAITPRSEAPAAIAATAEFRELCPDSATFMRKVLATNHSL